MSAAKFSIRPAHQADRQQLANLIHFEPLVHRHLDWREPLDWIGHQLFWVVEQKQKIVAVLACPPDLPEIAWIRLFAVSEESTLQTVWEALWTAARQQLDGQGFRLVAAMPLQEWFDRLLQNSHFVRVNMVITLTWEHHPLPVGERTPSLTLRPMKADDLPAVAELDAAAFGSLWRYSHQTLELAFRQSALATVAEKGGEIAAFQLSTAYSNGGHLARLATHPRFQGMGVGFALLQDTLARFEQRGARRVTVNTQADNLASLAMYRKAGFLPSGESYPVYQLCLRQS